MPQRFFGPRGPFVPWAPQHAVVPVVERLGPAFALLVPLQYIVETQLPESGLHPHTHDVHAAVSPGTAAILVVIVILVMVGEKMVARIVSSKKDVSHVQQ